MPGAGALHRGGRGEGPRAHGRRVRHKYPGQSHLPRQEVEQQNLQTDGPDPQSPKEAKYLVDMLEIYYAQPSESKLKLLKKFTNTPALFRHMELIDEINSIELEGSQLN